MQRGANVTAVTRNRARKEDAEPSRLAWALLRAEETMSVSKVRDAHPNVQLFVWYPEARGTQTWTAQTLPVTPPCDAAECLGTRESETCGFHGPSSCGIL